MEKKNRKISTLGMLLGILTIIGGIALIADLPDFFSYTGLRFGADFYTETHQILAAIANRIAAVNDTAGIGLSFILISMGAGEFLYFYKLRPVKEKKKKEIPPAAAPYAPDYTAAPYTPAYTPDTAAPYTPETAAPVQPPEGKTEPPAPEAPAAE